MSDARREPIAIVGIGCRLPGGITDPASLWRALTDGADTITTIPPDRFDAEALYDERPATPGRIMSRFGGFVDGIDGFDASFFEMSPREAERLDPQQRLLLETSWEALEDAGVARERHAGTNAGVYVGMWINEYESRLFAETDHIDFYMTTGTGRYAASGRLSYFLDLLGPSVTVDSACSSSLVAVHLACQGLAAGECDLALAGGANIIVEPFITIAYSQSRLMTPDGRCKFGDASANGFVRSDGVVMLALKRLSSAQTDGDHIYAVIRGSAVTNDGRSSGFLATPGQAGQEEMLRRAYADAGVDPGTVQYVEAHGTGTSAGDPVEVGAIGAVIGAVPGRTEPLLVGSIKSNIGHCEGAAGAAGLVKLALALEYGDVPASLHVARPNPDIPWAELKIEVPRERQPWPAVDGPRRGGVSAFGITGTNAHVVVEEPPPPVSSIAEPAPTSAFALPVTASSPVALKALAGRYLALLEDTDVPVADLCATAATRRSHLGDRLVAVGRDRAELARALEQRLAGLDAAPARSRTSSSVVFVFPGQGSQWLGMARQLLAEEPVFADTLRACDGAIRLETGWSPIEMLSAEEASPRIDDIDVVQPLLFAIQVSLAAQWRSWGIVPDAVIGHSMGEVAAAHVAGALDLADAVAVICRRSALLRRIAGQGAMALVDLDVTAATEALTGYETVLSIAVSNSRRSTVLSGDPGALRDVLDRLERDDVFCRPVKVDVASHSPQVDPLLPELRAALAEIRPHVGAIPFRSTVVVGGPTLGADYWAANLRQPVLFGAAIAALAASGPVSFVELSPHPVLLPSIDQVLNDAGVEGRAVASMRRGEPERATMLDALGALYEAGATVDWAAVTGLPRERVVLPTYPWQRERYWYETVRTGRRAGGHPLLGHALEAAGGAGTVHWQTTLANEGFAILREHIVQGSAILPGTGFAELGRAATGRGGAVRDLVLRGAMPLDAEHEREVQVTVDGSASLAHCQVWSRERPDGEWQLHAEMRVESAAAIDQGVATIDDIRRRCPEHRDGDAHAADMRARDLDYGESFRLVRDVWVGDGEAIGRIDASVLRPGSADRRIAVLDSSWQVALNALPRRLRDLTFVPVGAERILVEDFDDLVWSHAAVRVDDAGIVRCDVRVLTDNGAVVAVTDGLELRRVGHRRDRLDALLHELEWRPAPLVQPGPAAEEGRLWVVYASDAVGHDLGARLRAAGDHCVVVRPGAPIDHGTVLRDAVAQHDSPLAGVVYAWADGLSTPTATPAELAEAEAFGVLTPLAVIQALSGLDQPPPRLYLVTCGAHDVAPAQALLWGLGRVAANEQPALRCTLIDLGAGAASGVLYDEIRANAADDQVSYRDGERTVARLVPSPDAGRPAGPRTAESDAYRLAATTPGSLDSLRPVMQVRTAPAPGEVEVRIEAAALNFLDVLKAMGICPGFDPSADVALGAEAAGVVTAVGVGVDNVRVGDAVVAITPSYRHTSMLATYATVPAGFVQPRPPGLSVEQASALPVAYLTAYYTLCEMGHVRAGERVLVHAATGGVGLAAVEICRRLGAEVIATAGSERKRAHLRSLGVKHVLDSRTLDFAREVLEITDGRGVDVVLNSLTGDAIPAGLSVLAPRGRFLEIGKRDVYGGARIDLSPFRNNLSLHVVDLAAITEQDPAYMAELFGRVMAMVAGGQLPALPVSAVPITSATDAFREMAQAGHIGKLVLTVDPVPVPADAPLVRPDGTYLITGGTRGLGLAVAARLVELGARHLALVARGELAEQAAQAVAVLRSRGAAVRVLQADVGDAAAVTAAVATVRATMPPLRGVVHAAGVLADATIDTMDADRVHAALTPKLHGGWNLHHATLDDDLDHFVLFSSVAGLLGATGQANYAAGNAFLDALAAHRRAGGRPALSIEWGPWAEIGLAAEADNRGARLADRGLGSLDPDDGLDAFVALLAGDRVAVAVMPFDAVRWIDAQPTASGFLTELLTAAPAPPVGGATLRVTVEAAPGGPLRRRAMEDGICTELAPVLRVGIDRIDRQQAFKAMGLDSLMALELRNRLERASGLNLPATIVWNFPTVGLLAGQLAAVMGIALDGSRRATPVVAAPAVEIPATLSQDDLELQLLEELAAADRLLDRESS